MNQDDSLSFEIKRVEIFRPWLNPDVFANKYWMFDKDFSLKTISLGTFDLNKTDPPPAIPAVPTAFLLIKNIHLVAKDVKKLSTEVKNALSESASISIGPISFSGSHDASSDHAKKHYALDKVGLHSNGIQILAVLATCLPKSPNPDPSAKPLTSVKLKPKPKPKPRSDDEDDDSSDDDHSSDE